MLLDSLWGSSMWNASERFLVKPTTPNCVGPGSYNSLPSPWEKSKEFRDRSKFIQQHNSPTFSLKGTQIPSPRAESEMPIDSWKCTSDRPNSSKAAFDKAPRKTWVEVESSRSQKMRKRITTNSCPTLDLPCFLSGTKTGTSKSPQFPSF